MPIQLKLRRGTTAQHSTFTGAEGEVSVDTTKDTLVVHDGTTTGGRPLARQDGVGATGTWPVNISGSAASATTASSATTAGNVSGTVAIANGGTGATSAAAARANLGVGSVGVLNTNADTTQYLRGDGAWAGVAGYTGPRAQIFTSSGTFTVPSGVTAVKVTMAGAGGSGGGANGAFRKGGGGGSPGQSISYLTGLTPGSAITVTVGAGGIGNTTTGTAGGTTSFGSFVTLTGGGAGVGGVTQGAGGAAGTISGTVTYSADGVAGGSADACYNSGGGRALSSQSATYKGFNYLGTGGTGRSWDGNQGAGGNASGYGSGGGGAASAGPSFNGGNGSPGVVLVEY